MREIEYSVREFQARLGEVFRHVASGRRVVITSRRRRIAEVVPLNGDAGADSAEMRVLRRWEAEGRLVIGTGGPVKDFPLVPGAYRQLMNDREDRDRALQGLPPRRRRRR